jgi:hypothetical protein
MIARFWNPLWIQIWARLWNFSNDFHFLAIAMVNFLYRDIPLSPTGDTIRLLYAYDTQDDTTPLNGTTKRTLISILTLT